MLLDREKVLACAKHYVGDGGTINGIDENNTVIDRDGRKEKEKSIVEQRREGLGLICMPCYHMRLKFDVKCRICHWMFILKIISGLTDLTLLFGGIVI